MQQYMALRTLSVHLHICFFHDVGARTICVPICVDRLIGVLEHESVGDIGWKESVFICSSL